MNKKAYFKPSMKVVKLRRRTCFLCTSLYGNSKSVSRTSNNEGIDYVDEIGDTYGDN